MTRKPSPVERAADKYFAVYDLRVQYLGGHRGWSADDSEKLRRAHERLMAAALAARKVRKVTR